MTAPSRRPRAWPMCCARKRSGVSRMEFAGLGRLVDDLRLVLVEIETGVKLCLLRKEIFQAGFVLEGAAQLGTVIGEGLFLPLDFMVFVLGAAIETAEGVLDTLNRPQRILGVEIGLVSLLAPDEEIRLAVFKGVPPA
jgi:hypothetical protein